MKYQYSCQFSFDLAKLSPEVDDLMMSLNAAISSTGVRERISCYSGTFQMFVCTVDRKLTEEDKTKMKNMLTMAVNEVGGSLAKYGLVCSDIRRKSGKVLQSVTQ